MDAAYEKRVGQNLRRLREEKGFTQEQLAAHLQIDGCDLTRSALAKIEVGQRHIYIDELYAIRKVLKVSYEQLLSS